MYEQKIIKQLEERYQVKSQKLGLFYFTRQTYLGDYPDAIIGDDAIVDVKSPYAMEDLPISTGSKIKMLEFDNNENICLKKSTKWEHTVYSDQFKGNCSCQTENSAILLFSLELQIKNRNG